MYSYNEKDTVGKLVSNFWKISRVLRDTYDGRGSQRRVLTVLLKSGDVDFAIAQDIYHQGYRPLWVLRNYVQKHMEPSDETDKTSIDIICSENLGTFT